MKTWFGKCLIVMLFALQAQASQRAENPHPLSPRFLDVLVSTDHLTKSDRASMERRKAGDESVEWVIPVKIDLNALKGDRFEAFLFDRHVVIRRRESNLAPPQFGERWQGEVWLPGDAPDSDHMGLRDADFLIRRGRVTGAIRIGQIVYQLSSTSNGAYYIFKQDVSKLPEKDDVFVPDDAIYPSGSSTQPSYYIDLPIPRETLNNSPDVGDNSATR